MTPFQVIALSALGVVLAVEGIRWLRCPGSHGLRLIRCLVWAAAATAIAFPDLVQAVAKMLGIARGADVVLYLSVLLFLALAFFLYARVRKQQQQITDLVRHLALHDARRGHDGRAGRNANGSRLPTPSGN